MLTIEALLGSIKDCDHKAVGLLERMVERMPTR
jgi:hypothetical protein